MQTYEELTVQVDVEDDMRLGHPVLAPRRLASPIAASRLRADIRIGKADEMPRFGGCE